MGVNANRTKLLSTGKKQLFAACVVWAVSAGALAQGNEGGVLLPDAPEGGPIIIQGEDKTLETRDAMQGTFILPETASQDAKREKCMTVCARWGEDCLLINRGAGGMERKCRRTCKQFAEECF